MMEWGLFIPSELKDRDVGEKILYELCFQKRRNKLQSGNNLGT